MKILLAEDDEQLASNLVQLLRREAYAVDWVRTGVDAQHLGETGSYDCCVLDLGLPALEGLAVLRAWRANGCEFPVLILTARDAWMDKAEGFQSGADDYLVKPFLPQELILRVRALVRRSRGQAAEVVRCGGLAYYPGSGNFQLSEKPLYLTAFEIRILAKLIQFPEVLVERETLFDCIYEYEAEVPNNSLEVLIGRLRRKIAPVRIVTARGHGYRLTAEAA
ncbi:winged helix family two component transcriptional regulator [Novosphingobium sp. PhB165]|uniref:response regulator n=1 Tax=Novosphingobium sp. PhB165 TaxID=2485105 RepID=UPI0010505D6C|nr:response regulator [Novosphingobium sp. PhB165]TCM16585.1 winged helix family two component transcriptional regulator [Novosphingobium sp. PhB165]